MESINQKLAITAYSAHCREQGNVTDDGKLLPTFEQLGDGEQQCWLAAIAAAKAQFLEELVK